MLELGDSQEISSLQTDPKNGAQVNYVGNKLANQPNFSLGRGKVRKQSKLYLRTRGNHDP